MKRSDVLNALVAVYEEPSYLEIGVERGVTFHAVKARRKVAVDPKFDFVLPETPDANTRYHQTTSDVFFADFFADAGPDQRFDLIFIDGLHTLEQTLRDFTNAIAVLNPGGAVVIDDVIPDSYPASIPDRVVSDQVKQALDITSRSWMGDVYRLIFFIRSFFQQFDYATVAESQGQAVVWKSARPAEFLDGRSVEQIARLPYEDILLNRSAFNIKPLADIVALVEQSARRRDDGQRGKRAATQARQAP